MITVVLDKGNGHFREFTLQTPSRQGNILSWLLDARDMGRTDTGDVAVVFHGWRRILRLRWSVATKTGFRYSLNSGSSWTTVADVPTAFAVTEIVGMDSVSVTWGGSTFQARGLSGYDLKGAAAQYVNREMELMLTAVDLDAEIVV